MQPGHHEAFSVLEHLEHIILIHTDESAAAAWMRSKHLCGLDYHSDAVFYITEKCLDAHSISYSRQVRSCVLTCTCQLAVSRDSFGACKIPLPFALTYCPMTPTAGLPHKAIHCSRVLPHHGMQACSHPLRRTTTVGWRLGCHPPDPVRHT